MEYNIHPTSIIQMGTLRPKEAEDHLESHNNHLGEGVPHIPSTDCTLRLSGLSPHPSMSLSP